MESDKDKFDLKEALSKKPEFDKKCNGCGLCCMMEVCAIGKGIYGKRIEAPCPALMKDTKLNRFFCGVVKMEKESGTKPVFAEALGIGKGCDCTVEAL